jgi:hypothetical protein
MCSSHPSLLSSVTFREHAPQVAAPVGQTMSGLIVLGIVAIWIVVLVPVWLNRHEADSASRSMDTFSTAMRVLSHRTPSRADRRYLVLPRDNWGVTVDNQSDSVLAPPRRSLLPALRLPMVLRLSRRQKFDPPMSGRARLVARRRKISVAFAVVTIGLAVSAVVFHTSWWFELGAGLALAGYVIHLRNEAIRVEQTRRRRSQRLAREAAARMPGAQRYYGSSRGDSAIDLGGESAMVGIVAAPASASGTENGSRWEPVAVPLPTYVSKPVVARPAAAAPRADAESGTIDLTRPGAWVDSQVDVRHLLLDESVPAPVPRVAEADELDAILERRRAVND